MTDIHSGVTELCGSERASRRRRLGETSEGGGGTDPGRRDFQLWGNSKGQGPGVGLHLECSRKSKEARRLEVGEGGGSGRR